MSFWQSLLSFLDTSMKTPLPYGGFHILFFILSFLAVIPLVRRQKLSPERIRRVVLITAMIVTVLEIYKQINFSFTYKNGQILFDYQWYAFPFQFCSTPMYIGLLAAVIKNERIHQSLCAYLGTYSLFAGLCVMF